MDIVVRALSGHRATPIASRNYVFRGDTNQTISRESEGNSIPFRSGTRSQSILGKTRVSRRIHRVGNNVTNYVKKKKSLDAERFPNEKLFKKSHTAFQPNAPIKTAISATTISSNFTELNNLHRDRIKLSVQPISLGPRGVNIALEYVEKTHLRPSE